MFYILILRRIIAVFVDLQMCASHFWGGHICLFGNLTMNQLAILTVGSHKYINIMKRIKGKFIQVIHSHIITGITLIIQSLQVHIIQILMIYWKLNFLTITFIQITLFIVWIYHAYCLQKWIYNDWAYKGHTSIFQIFWNLVRQIVCGFIGFINESILGENS